MRDELIADFPVRSPLLISMPRWWCGGESNYHYITTPTAFELIDNESSVIHVA
jgi:hypothetical protein